MKMISSISLLGILLVLSLCLLSFPIPGSSQADKEYVINDCNNATLYRPNSTFASNLKPLLSSLSSNSKRGTRFYNSTSGRSTDTVYASFLCRDDVTADVCQDCVQDAAEQILSRCPNQQKAIIWYAECMLRYSNRPFFSTMEAAPQRLLTNTANVNDPDRFTQLLTDAMGLIATRAASGNTSVRMFATEEFNFTRSQTLYTLVQCTPDISSSDCNRCLGGGIPQAISCCSTRLGARFLRPSCNGRFELYPFYRITAPPPATPTNRTNTADAGKSRKSSRIIIAITILVAVVMLLIVGTISCLRSKKPKPKSNVDYEGVNPECLQYDLDTIRKATHNFSEDNKIGKGGFGDVYKGLLSDGQEIAVNEASITELEPR